MCERIGRDISRYHGQATCDGCPYSDCMASTSQSVKMQIYDSRIIKAHIPQMDLDIIKKRRTLERGRREAVA